ncbi:peptidoglycan editing factor PgeF [Limibacillus halophilus]|jgi:YfiH family protein
MLTLGRLNELRGLRHAFFTREGGVSEGLYASLNCGYGSGDDKERVRENRSRAMAALSLPPDALHTVYQHHSPDVVELDESWNGAEPPKADALVTRKRGLALGILTADCVPVLLADESAGVIGAAHAGWKGALGGVLESVVGAMEKLGARREAVIAGIGPAIEQRSYEVGPEFPGPFLREEAGNADFFAPSPRQGHFLFDLKGYVARRLGRCGVGEIHSSPADTRAESERFFSYRRATLQGERDYGRGLSTIVLEP